MRWKINEKVVCSFLQVWQLLCCICHIIIVERTGIFRWRVGDGISWFIAKYLPLGKVSLALNSIHEEPATESEEDRQAADRAYQFMLGWFAHPIYVNGDYPQVMKDQIANKSAMQGYKRSRLPEFTAQEKNEIKGKTDSLIYIDGIPGRCLDPDIIHYQRHHNNCHDFT